MTGKSKIYIALIAVVAVAIGAMFILHAVSGGTDESAAASSMFSDNTEKVVITETEHFTKVKKTITSEVIQEGLNDMGVLVTEEYYFTEVINYEKAKSVLNINIGFLESNVLVSYDGKILAGIDFSKIEVTKDDMAKTLNVTLPQAEIQSVDIDPDSFVKHSEKESIGNRLTVEDFNLVQVQLRETAEKKALERGLLEHADENAEIIVGNFIRSLPDLDEYTLGFAYR